MSDNIVSQANDIENQRICFFGAGSMAEAIVRGLIHQQLVPNEQISMLNRQNKDRLQQLHMHYGIQTILQGKTNEQYLQEADIIFLAMKPKDAVEAIREIKPLLRPSQLIISVIAGLSISALEKLLGAQYAVVRTMPNTSSTIGLGATGISYSSTVSEHQQFITETIFQSIGAYLPIEENLQDAITSISGSGPAYVYYFMESMIKGGVQNGLTEEQAKQLVVQTFLGAAHMVQKTNEQPAELRRKVTSPNGTTQAALEKMAELGLQDAIVQGIVRCAERSQEIGKSIEEGI